MCPALVLAVAVWLGPNHGGFDVDCLNPARSTQSQWGDIIGPYHANGSYPQPIISTSMIR